MSDVRILHVVASGERRGAEVFASDLVRALGDSPLRQRVAVLRANGWTAVAYNAPTLVIRADGGPTRRGLDPATVRSLRRSIAAWRPHIVQAHGGEPLKYSIPAAAGLGARVVYRRIGATPEWVASGVQRTAYGWLMRRAARTVAVAEAVRRETMATFGLPASRIVTIPNGVDVDRLDPPVGRTDARRALSVPARVRVLLSVGAFTLEKDPLAQLQVAARVFAEVDGAILLMAGSGPLQGEVEATIRRLGLEERVRLLGSRPDVNVLLGASDLLLLASSTEGMPAVVIEAGMVGLPVVSYAIGGVPEVVADGSTGLLAPPGDVEALATLAVELLRDRQRRSAMGRAARARCRARFDIGSVASRYALLYEELARGRGGQAATDREGTVTRTPGWC